MDVNVLPSISKGSFLSFPFALYWHCNEKFNVDKLLRETE